MFDALKIGFSMYSKIPMPNTKWTKDNMKYAICFFPIVGVCIGIIVYLWGLFCDKVSLSDICRACGYVSIPILITGGIHVDGFVDTMDAISSYQDTERKLEILKDSHIGAFALIGGITYFIIQLGIFSEVTLNELGVVCIGYVLSRSLSGYSIVTFKCAKNSGLAATFSNNAHKRNVRLVMIIYIIICIALMILLNYQVAIGAILASVISFLYYYKMSYKKFFGITGDLAGYFLQICELLIVFSTVIVNKIM